ncbi:HNH endonuclease [Streptomyces sp. NPDC057623]|uniref:HNH endonuclease n=1 Tax=Streptomyces sp. NPDC057623 TaxID=3346187 RepID=UPI0036BA849C
MRTAVLRCDGFRCLACGSEDDLTVDPIGHQWAGGRYEMENLRMLCRSCSGRRGSGHLSEVDGESGAGAGKFRRQGHVVVVVVVVVGMVREEYAGSLSWPADGFRGCWDLVQQGQELGWCRCGWRRSARRRVGPGCR